MYERGINQPKIDQFYRNKGINVIVKSPCTAEDEDTYAEMLFQAAKHLYDLVDLKGHRVYVHCSTGVSRSPTLFLCYQALFMKSNLSLPDMQKELRKLHSYSTPNMKMI